MKITSVILIAFFFTVSACTKQGNHEHATEEGPNQELYDEVMAVHDEVMPKMTDLYKAKTALSTQLEMPGLTDDEREGIRQKIIRIDSASEGMMVWMRQFDPPADSVGADAGRAYLEDQLVKVKKVREDILETLEANP